MDSCVFLTCHRERSVASATLHVPHSNVAVPSQASAHIRNLRLDVVSVHIKMGVCCTRVSCHRSCFPVWGRELDFLKLAEDGGLSR